MHAGKVRRAKSPQRPIESGPQPHQSQSEQHGVPRADSRGGRATASRQRPKVEAVGGCGGDHEKPNAGIWAPGPIPCYALRGTPPLHYAVNRSWRGSVTAPERQTRPDRSWGGAARSTMQERGQTPSWRNSVCLGSHPWTSSAPSPTWTADPVGGARGEGPCRANARS